MSQNIPTILFNNGFNIEEMYISDYKINFDEKEIKDFDNSPDMQNVLEKSKDYLERFLMGFEFKKHKIDIDLKNILINVNWSKFGIALTKAPFSEMDNKGGIIFTLELEAPQIKVDIEQVRLRDLNNDFLGEFGVNNVFTEITEGSAPLTISLPIQVFSKGEGEFGFKALTPYSNADQLSLDLEYASPLILPKFEVRINDRVFGLNQDEVEKEVKNSKEVIIQSLKENMQQFIDEDLFIMLTKMLNEKFSKAALEVNEMDPPGTEDPKVEKYKWGIEINSVDIKNNFTTFKIDGFVEDPLNSRISGLPSFQAAQIDPNYGNLKSEEYDAALSINQGFINRLLQLSYSRGYYKEFDVENEDQPIKLSQQPMIKINNKNGISSASLDIQIEYNVTGLSKVFVKNPIKIDFDIDLDLKMTADGKVQMSVKKIDLDSVNVDSKYIRMFAGKVRSSVRDKFKSITAMNGMILLDEFPVPESIAGIPLKVSGVELDKNGYMMILLDFNFLQ